MFVQSHFQRNRHHLQSHQHHQLRHLDQHKSSKSLNATPNLTLSSSNSSFGLSSSRSAKTAPTLKAAQLGSHSPATISSSNTSQPSQATKSKRELVDQSFWLEEPDFREIQRRAQHGVSSSLSCRKRQSLYRREFSFDEDAEEAGRRESSLVESRTSCLERRESRRPAKEPPERVKRSQSLSGELLPSYSPDSRSELAGKSGKKSFSTESDSVLGSGGGGARVGKLNNLLVFVSKQAGERLSFKEASRAANWKSKLETCRQLADHNYSSLKAAIAAETSCAVCEEMNMYGGGGPAHLGALYRQASVCYCGLQNTNSHAHQHSGWEGLESYRKLVAPPAPEPPPPRLSQAYYTGSAYSQSVDQAHFRPGAGRKVVYPAASQRAQAQQARQPRPQAHARDSLSSQLSLHDYDSTGDGSLKEDALSQFIINVSSERKSREPSQQELRRRVLRQTSALNEPELALGEWLAGRHRLPRQLEPARQLALNSTAGSQQARGAQWTRRLPRENQINEARIVGQPVLAEFGHEARRNSRNLLDKRYSNSWDCNGREQRLPPLPASTEKHPRTLSSSQAASTPPQRSLLEARWREAQSRGGGSGEANCPGRAARVNIERKVVASDSEFYTETTARGQQVLVEANLRQRSNEESSFPKAVEPTGVGRARPSSQSSNASSASKKLPVGLSPGKLSLAGAKRRFGFKQKNAGGLTSLSVQRSEEVVPFEAARQLIREMTFNSMSDSGNESGSGNNTSHSTDPRACFVEGLGAGQVASRQALVSPYLGDIQLAISDRRGLLEVEVVRARQLQIKVGAKILPSPYVKIYLMKDKKCIAKCKTTTARRTLNPLFQQQFVIREDYTNCVLQVIVWADYGKKDRKSLMGIVQINLPEIDISKMVIDWYRLFNAPSMVCSVQSSKSLRHSLLPKQAS